MSVSTDLLDRGPLAAVGLRLLMMGRRRKGRAVIERTKCPSSTLEQQFDGRQWKSLLKERHRHRLFRVRAKDFSDNGTARRHQFNAQAVSNYIGYDLRSKANGGLVHAV